MKKYYIGVVLATLVYPGLIEVYVEGGTLIDILVPRWFWIFPAYMIARLAYASTEHMNIGHSRLEKRFVVPAVLFLSILMFSLGLGSFTYLTSGNPWSSEPLFVVSVSVTILTSLCAMVWGITCFHRLFEERDVEGRDRLKRAYLSTLLLLLIFESDDFARNLMWMHEGIREADRFGPIVGEYLCMGLVVFMMYRYIHTKGNLDEILGFRSTAYRWVVFPVGLCLCVELINPDLSMYSSLFSEGTASSLIVLPFSLVISLVFVVVFVRSFRPEQRGSGNSPTSFRLSG